MKKSLIASAVLFGFALAAPSTQAAGPMSPAGFKAADSASSVQQVHRKRVCRRSCTVRGWGHKKRRVCRSVCYWRR